MSPLPALYRLLHLLCRVCVSLGLLAALPCAAATTLSLAHIYPPEHPTTKAAQRFAELVGAHSQGRVQIKIFPESSSGHQTASIRSLKNGSLDLTILSQGVVAEIVPEFNALGLPYLFQNQAAAWRVLDGPIGQQLKQKAEAKGLLVLDFWDIELRHFANSRHPIIKPADLRGLKMRTPPDPMTVDIVATLGAVPKEVNYSLLHHALQSGLVDGQDNQPASFMAARLDEVQKFYSLTGHKVSVFSFLMNKASFERLPPADREAVKVAAQEASWYQRTLVRNLEEDALRELAARGVRINTVDTQPFVAATATVYDKWYASPIGDFVRAVVQAAREEP